MSPEALRADYDAMLREIGVTEAQVQMDMAATGFLVIQHPAWELFESPIHGIGLRARLPILSGTYLGWVVLKPGENYPHMKTTLGRYLNHSPDPNTSFLLLAGDRLVTVATKDVRVGHELTTDYRIIYAMAQAQSGEFQ